MGGVFPPKFCNRPPSRRRRPNRTSANETEPNPRARSAPRRHGWARARQQRAAEVAVGPQSRYEIIVASQVDRLPARVSVGALAVVAKWYY